MADLKEKKFGCGVQSHPTHPPCQHINAMPPPPPPPRPIPVGMTMQDWINYINSYIDVRARQLYNKLAGLVPSGGSSGGNSGSQTDENEPKDYIRLKDQNNSGDIYRVFIKDGVLCSNIDVDVPNDQDDNWYWGDNT